MKQQFIEQNRASLKEIEEENLLIIEGLKSEYEDRIREVQNKLQKKKDKIKALKQDLEQIKK